MYPHVAANTHGYEGPRLIVLVAMMNQEPRPCLADAAAKMVAFHYLFAQSVEETHGMMPPVVTGTAAATPFKFGSPAACTGKLVA